MDTSSYTIDHYRLDTQAAARRSVNAQGWRPLIGHDIAFLLEPSRKVNAFASGPRAGRYEVCLCEGLLSACLAHFRRTIPSYVERNRATFAGKEHKFLRQTCQAAAQMVLGHELAHILRGHLVFLSKKGMLQDGVLAECGVHHESGEQMAWRRFLELDADIYGAQFSLADTVVQFAAGPREQWLTAIAAYTIGVRGLFEVLRNPRSPHDAAMAGDYPHPISRAYLAVSHGIARLGDGPLAHLANTGAEAVARQVLLEYEHRELGLPVEEQVLQAFFATEVKYWHARESMLLPYQLTSAVANRSRAKVGR